MWFTPRSDVFFPQMEHFITSTFSLFPLVTKITICPLFILHPVNSCFSVWDAQTGRKSTALQTPVIQRGWGLVRTQHVPPGGMAEQVQMCWCCWRAGWGLCNSASSEDNILMWEPVCSEKQQTTVNVSICWSKREISDVTYYSKLISWIFDEYLNLRW